MISAEKKIGTELRSHISGDVVFDNAILEHYSTLHCIYKVRPLAIVYPKSIEDVQRTVHYCSENEIALIPRGGGTGLVGQAIGLGIILDLSKYLNNIYTLEENLLHLQAGCTVQSINEYLKPFHRHYPIDPQSAKWCTIGGNIATNASGAHGIKYGATKDVVKEITVVLSNGEVVTLTNVGMHKGSEVSAKLFRTAAEKLSSKEKLIQSKKLNVLKNSSGYNIFESIQNHSFDPIKLFCGSEGTLGIVVEAKIETVPIPKSSQAVILYCNSYEKTAKATQLALTFQPIAIELLDKSYSDYGKGMSAIIDSLIEPDFQALLLVEFNGDNEDELKKSISLLVQAESEAHCIIAHRFLDTDEERISAWQLREGVAIKLNQLKTERKKASIVEDGAVSIENLPRYLSELKKIFQHYEIPFTVYGHVGTGNIHCSTFVDFKSDQGRKNIELATVEIFNLLIALKGTLSGEHGDGFVRTPFLKRAFGEEMYELFTEVKNIFDPQNFLNPNKIIGKQDGNFLHDIKYN